MLKKLFALVIVLVVCTVAAGYALWWDMQRYMNAPLALTQDVPSYELKRGTGFSQLVDSLAQEGSITHPLYLKLYARINPAVAAIKAGEYSIEASLSPVALLAKLVNGDSVRHYVTIVEGTTFGQLRSLLNEQGELLKLTLKDKSDREILALLGAKVEHPEGLFLAETYQIERGTTDLALLQRSYTGLQQALEKHWQSRDEKLPYKTPYEALIMASIVEKETAVPQERPLIAGVFVKRMNIGMRLQTDPTVIYGMGERYKGNITRKDLQRPTPYNTYTIDGLPPTPIALVGEDAIKAALNPDIQKWLYFVAKGDGSHQFSASLAEHNRAVRAYQLTRKQDYRSTPE